MHASTDSIYMKTRYRTQCEHSHTFTCTAHPHTHTQRVNGGVLYVKSSRCFEVPKRLQVFEPWCGNIDDSALHEYNATFPVGAVRHACSCLSLSLLLPVCVLVVHVQVLYVIPERNTFVDVKFSNFLFSHWIFSGGCVFVQQKQQAALTNTPLMRWLPCDVCMFQCSCPKDI